MSEDWLAESGDLFLGSRLKRLGEQLQNDANHVSRSAGVSVQPGQLPLLALLSQRGPQTVGELARGMGLSQPVVTRNVAKLVELALLQMDPSAADGRSKIVSLTHSGERTIDRARETLWPHVAAAVRQVVDGLSGPLLAQIGQLERALAERSLAARAASSAAAELVPAKDADIPGIVALMNLAYRGSGSSSGWSTEAGYITGDRTTEALLRADVAGKPHASLLTWRDRRDGTLQGCVWLEPLGGTTWYLGSLAVDPRRQNGGLGHSLLRSAEQWLRERGAERVRISVVNVRGALIAWYERRDYHLTGETAPFPYGDDRFGTPQRDDLSFIILEKALTDTHASR
jgi:DNA-binding MarR family transcriptional regulator/ribosomal protein S18 acetylase RimI-like enzyme